MTAKFVIPAQSRSKGSKGAVRQMRREGLIPGVIYGSGKEATPIAITQRNMVLAMQEGGFMSNLHTIEVDGKKVQVLPRELQRHPVNGMIQHADFLRVDAKRKIHVSVPVRVVGEDECPGVKIGGVVSLMRDEIEVVCRADSIPAFLEISVAGLKIAESAHASSIKLPEGVEFAIQDRDFTVANILSTRTSTMAEMAEGEEGAEAASAE